MLYEIHTQGKMYTVNAVYFMPKDNGVMFFDEQDRGVAYVPNMALDLVRENKKTSEDEMNRIARESFSNSIQWRKNEGQPF